MRLLLAILCAAALSGCASYPVMHGVPNWGIVEPETNGMAGIYRGGEPTPAGWQYLMAIGATNIVQLDLGNCHAPPGFNVMRFPISLWKQYLGNPGPKLEAAYAAMEDNPRQVLVHCAHGANRTGTIVILWRVRHDGWTKADAIAEANRYGWSSTGWALKLYARKKGT